jgi:hypothetical protein
MSAQEQAQLPDAVVSVRTCYEAGMRVMEACERRHRQPENLEPCAPVSGMSFAWGSTAFLISEPGLFF